MKLTRKLSVLFVVFVMILSSFSYSAVFADSEAADLTAESGTYTADKTKPYDGNWNIVSWLTDKPFSYLDKDMNKYVLQPEPGKDIAFIVGGVPVGSSITSFKLDVSKWLNESSDTVQLYATDDIYSVDYKWTKLKWVKKFDSTLNQDYNNICTVECNNIPKACGYRYIKVVLSTKRGDGDTWADCISGFSFSWDKNDVIGAKGSYTTDIAKPYDGNWHILSWKDDFKAAYANYDYNNNYYMGSQSAFEYITGGIPNGSGITQFSIDVTNKIYQEKYVDIYVSDSLDGKWTKCDYTVADNVTDNDQNAAMTTGNLRQRITFNFDKSNGYRYIKVSRVAAPQDDWAYLLGGFSFSWDKNDVIGAKGSYTTDIKKPYDGNWHILSWKDNFKAGCSNWDYNGNYHMDSESAFEYITGGIPNGSGITQFSIDVTNLIYQKKYVDIYVSDSLDGNWIKCDYTVADNVSDNDQNATMTGGNLRQRITFNFDKSNGYRYIKVSRVAAPEDTWAYELGGFSFSWDGIPDVTVDYAKDGNSLKATVKLVNQSDFLPFIVFAGYDSEGTLLKASYHSEGLLNGSKKIEYVIPSKDISKARLFVWNQENLSPAATLGDFNAAK